MITEYRSLVRGLTFVLLSLVVVGCSIQSPVTKLVVPPPPPIPSQAPSPMSFDEQQQMIMHLLRVLSEKEAEISTLRAHQQSQTEELKETSSQVARAEVKLRRFASEAEVASHLAEVEVAMEVLRATLGIEHKASLQQLAQRLLDSALTAFQQDEYRVAADLVAQAEQFIAMLMDNSIASTEAASEVAFSIAIPLSVKADSHLRGQPDITAAKLHLLKKKVPVVARAYQGQWLYVESEVGDAGWIMVELLEAP